MQQDVTVVAGTLQHAIIVSSTTQEFKMFKYTIHATLKSSARGATLTIKTEEDWNVADRMEQLGLMGKYNVVPAMERIFGHGNVQECSVVEKTQMVSQA
jgi:hypothetical protein